MKKTIQLFILCLLLAISNSAVGQANHNFNIEVKEMDSFYFLYYEFTGPYNQSFNNFSELMGYLKANNIEISPYSVGVFYDDPEQVAPEKLKSEIGVMVKKCPHEIANYKCKTIAASQVVSTTYHTMEEIMGAYKAIGNYISEHKISTAPYSLEIYKNQSPEEVNAEIVFIISN